MRRALITGASRGIGRAIAIKLAKIEYSLILHGRDEKALSRTRQMVSDAGGKAEMVTADLASESGVEQVVQAVGNQPLDLLVNNAGVAIVKPFDELTVEQWKQTLAVNVTAPYLLARKLISRMPQGASIVNILSVAARAGFPNWSSYCASKFALEGLMQSIREELRPRGVRVINIYPSATKTEMWGSIEGNWPKEKMISPEEVARAVEYAVTRPANVLVENISVGDISGTL